MLGVDEASVRRGLKKIEELRRERARQKRRERDRRWLAVPANRKKRRAYQRAALTTPEGQRRARKFRLQEQLTRPMTTTEEKA